MFTTSHSERHILLQLQSPMPACVSLLKKHTALPSGTCLFHCEPLKLASLWPPSQRKLLLVQQLNILTECVCFGIGNIQQ